MSDTLFCNDRTTPGKTITLWTSDTSNGHGTQATGYGALGRFMTGNNGTSLSERTGIQPTFKCSQKNDAFTVNDTSKGNGALTYSVGLITADEIVAAGSGKYNTNNTSYYLHRGGNYYYWSLSPFSMYTNGFARVFNVSFNGYLYHGNVSGSAAVAPVINLSYEYASTLIGDGTMENPYQEA